MGLEGKESLGRKNEKEGGTVIAITKPVDDRINDPKSVSKFKNNLTSLYSNLLQLTLIYSNLHQFTPIYTNFLQFTLIYSNLLQFTPMYTNLL